MLVRFIARSVKENQPIDTRHLAAREYTSGRTARHVRASTMPNFFERASAGISSLINDATVRSRAARQTTQAIGKVTGDFGDRLSRALSLAAIRRGKDQIETDDLCDLQVGSTCYEDSPGFMRTQLWESLLSRVEREGSSIAHGDKGQNGDAHADDTLDDMCAILADGDYYETLQDAFAAKSERALAKSEAGKASKKSKGWNENVGSAIERDLSRTFPNHEFFVASTSKGAEGREKLKRILKAYAVHDGKVGYCQGMAFVAGLLLIYLPNESRAFAALVTLMEQGDFRSMYLHGMEGLKTRIRQLSAVLRVKNPTLAQHLEAHDVTPLLYASSWFMSCFASDFSVRFSGRVMDCLLARRSSAFVMRVALAMLNEASGDLLKLNDFEAIVVYLRSEPRAWPRARLNAVVEQALNMCDLDEANIKRLDKVLLDAEAVVPRAASPSPLKSNKSKSKTRKRQAKAAELIDIGDDTKADAAEHANVDEVHGDEADEDDEEDEENANEHDEIMEMLMALEMGDDWSIVHNDTDAK